MMKVRQSFDELYVGDLIKVKHWNYTPRIIEKYSGHTFRVQGNGSKHVIRYDQYEYTLCEDWPHGQGIRYVAVRLPLAKLKVGMQVASRGNHGSLPIKDINAETICLDNFVTGLDFYINYENEYNYSLLRPQDAAELIEDPLQALALSILGGDPQALDAAKDILKC